MYPMLNTAIQAARNAARIIVRFVDRIDVLDIKEKNQNDFVTQVDQLSEQEIIQTIRRAYPDHTILAEESGLHKSRDDFIWIVDPLDGTTNFIHGFPQIAISIALKYREKLVIAVVYDPLYQELFTAVRGSGAQLNNRKIRVSTCAKINEALIGASFPFKEQALLQTYIKSFKAILPKAVGIRRSGSAALDLAYVASGRLDGCWEIGLKPWDMAAGVLLVVESGGFIGDLRGKENYMEGGNVVAGNNKIYKSLLKLIAHSKN
ncbi:inositol monophosphatase [Coxiella endosymbiont of Amblyomma sculptum]|uniref:inositol monophosphatase family protein n=1 Tax=Coxiella endosymbiont of Amblyomma sculptum TaxID=2487929 RepID=UPI00132E8BF0|nr:inositol monophosphatase family protein [Coxiella endosymbiont of Amblyomma sculptum]QHG92584.1 inositol monophosphatase [Coxiella endosymbiont of Amblyomma sculptum]